MVKISLPILILTSLLSCGKPVSIVNSRDVSPELEPYVSRFEDEMGLTVDFGVHIVPELHPGSLGECAVDGYGRKEITIKSGYFDNASEAQREQLVYHELGHCLLGKGHKKGRVTFADFPSDMPESIMHPNAFNLDQIKAYTAHRHYYLTELKEK